MNASPSNDLPCLPLRSAIPQAAVESFIPVAREFDVDNRTGFMAPRPPIARLPIEWEIWEGFLDEAVSAKLQLGDKIGLTHGEAKSSRDLRTRAREVSRYPAAESSHSDSRRRLYYLWKAWKSLQSFFGVRTLYLHTFFTSTSKAHHLVNLSSFLLQFRCPCLGYLNNWVYHRY